LGASAIAETVYRRARCGQRRVLAILTVLVSAGTAPTARGSGWLRALGCPPLRATVVRKRGRWARDASGGGSELGMGCGALVSRVTPRGMRRRRKRCAICNALFWPDPRVRKTQGACRDPSCQAARRKETQRRWRAEHPEDAAGRRLRDALARAAAEDAMAEKTGAPGLLLAPLPRSPPRGIPWDELRDAISRKGLVITRFFVNYAWALSRDVRLAHVPEITGKIDQQAPSLPEDPTAPRAPAA